MVKTKLDHIQRLACILRNMRKKKIQGILKNWRNEVFELTEEWLIFQEYFEETYGCYEFMNDWNKLVEQEETLKVQIEMKIEELKEKIRRREISTRDGPVMFWNQYEEEIIVKPLVLKLGTDDYKQHKENLSDEFWELLEKGERGETEQTLWGQEWKKKKERDDWDWNKVWEDEKVEERMQRVS